MEAAVGLQVDEVGGVLARFPLLLSTKVIPLWLVYVRRRHEALMKKELPSYI